MTGSRGNESEKCDSMKTLFQDPSIIVSWWVSAASGLWRSVCTFHFVAISCFLYPGFECYLDILCRAAGKIVNTRHIAQELRSMCSGFVMSLVLLRLRIPLNNHAHGNVSCMHTYFHVTKICARLHISINRIIETSNLRLWNIDLASTNVPYLNISYWYSYIVTMSRKLTRHWQCLCVATL